MSDKPKAPRISSKVKAAIDIMVSGDAKTITDAAAAAGLSREHLSRELSRPHVTEHLHQKVKRAIATGAARAGVTKLALLDSPNEMVRDRASSFVLGGAGIVPASDPQPLGERRSAPGLIIVIERGNAEPKIIGPEAALQIPAARTIAHQP